MLLYVVYLERHSPCREKAALGSGLGAEGFAGRHAGVTVQKSQTSLPSAQVLQECGQVRLGPVTAGSVQLPLAWSSYCWLIGLQETCIWSTVPHLHSILYRSYLNCSAEWLDPASKGKGTQCPCSEIDGCIYLYRSNPRSASRKSALCQPVVIASSTLRPH